MFAAEFRLLISLTKSKNILCVEALIDQLGLRNAAKMVIGDEGHRAKMSTVSNLSVDAVVGNCVTHASKVMVSTVDEILITAEQKEFVIVVVAPTWFEDGKGQYWKPLSFS